jgi:alcohol dehydrogenase (cytochrome c)
MGRLMNFVAGGVLVVGAVAATTIYENWNEAVQIVSMGVNYIRYIGASAGTISTEVAAGYQQPMPTRQNSPALANDADPGGTIGRATTRR